MTSPTIVSVSAAITFEENAVNATPAALAPNIVVADPEGDFDGGALRVSGLLPIVDLAAVSSISFLREVFALYAAQRPFALRRDGLVLHDRPGLLVTERIDPAADAGWFCADPVSLSGEAIAQIVFTSGTEGPPKAILISGRALGCTEARLVRAMGATPEIREYVGVPVTYSFGLGRVRAAVAVGGAVYLPPNGFDPAEIRRMLEGGEINAISAVPSLWRVLLARPETLNGAGAAVRWIEIGSQAMSRPEKEAMKALFPNARIVQHYGLTEASRTTFLIVSEESGNRLDSVGALEVESEATDKDGIEVAIGSQGEIRIRGPHLASGMLDVKGRFVPLTDADGWLVTHDRGEIRDGMLRHLGRLDDQINIGGLKVGAEALEQDIAAMAPGLAGHFAVAAVPDPLRGGCGAAGGRDGGQRRRRAARGGAAPVLARTRHRARRRGEEHADPGAAAHRHRQDPAGGAA